MSLKKYIKNVKKNLAICGLLIYNIPCCDIDSVEAEVAAKYIKRCECIFEQVFRGANVN